jgi:hypothetical protein
MGKLSDLMIGGVLATKYSDPSNPNINVQIKNTLISNTLINLGDSINVMTCDTMQSLGLVGLRKPQQYFNSLTDQPLNQREY